MNSVYISKMFYTLAVKLGFLKPSSQLDPAAPNASPESYFSPAQRSIAACSAYYGQAGDHLAQGR